MFTWKWGRGFTKKQKNQKLQTGGDKAHANVCYIKKVINESCYSSWSQFLHSINICVGDHTSLWRIKIVDSPKLTAA